MPLHRSVLLTLKGGVEALQRSRKRIAKEKKAKSKKAESARIRSHLARRAAASSRERRHAAEKAKRAKK